MTDAAEIAIIPTRNILRGDPDSFTIEDFAADGTTPTDLTAYGSSWTAMLRPSADTSPPVSFTIDATNAATGVLVLSLDAATTAALLQIPYVYDVQVTGGTTSPMTLYSGAIRVTLDVTHA